MYGSSGWSIGTVKTEKYRSELVVTLDACSFFAFWLGLGQNVRRQVSREKTDVILKLVVKQFFVEKEVTSTL
ncbi:hypothetical protein MKW98_020330, partial [Papaver atlanticum]